MAEKISLDDMNYAIYTVGNWKNSYKINQIGISHEVPATELTLEHVKFSMEEIRNSEFDLDNEKVNGFIALAYTFNPEIQKMDVKDIIKLEQEEFELISEELEALEVLSEGEIPLENEDYLVYKLEKEDKKEDKKDDKDKDKEKKAAPAEKKEAAVKKKK